MPVVDSSEIMLTLQVQGPFGRGHYVLTH